MSNDDDDDDDVDDDDDEDDAIRTVLSIEVSPWLKIWE